MVREATLQDLLGFMEDDEREYYEAPNRTEGERKELLARLQAEWQSIPDPSIEDLKPPYMHHTGWAAFESGSKQVIPFYTRQWKRQRRSKASSDSATAAEQFWSGVDEAARAVVMFKEFLASRPNSSERKDAPEKKSGVNLPQLAQRISEDEAKTESEKRRGDLADVIEEYNGLPDSEKQKYPQPDLPKFADRTEEQNRKQEQSGRHLIAEFAESLKSQKAELSMFRQSCVDLDNNAEECENGPKPRDQTPNAESQEIKTTESGDSPEATRSATMARFFKESKRVRSILADIGHYFMRDAPHALLFGLVFAGGGFALAVAVIPDKIYPIYYLIAECSFSFGVILFFGTCIYDFRTHNERRAITNSFLAVGLVFLAGVIGLFEWGRPAVRHLSPDADTVLRIVPQTHAQPEYLPLEIVNPGPPVSEVSLTIRKLGDPRSRPLQFTVGGLPSGAYKSVIEDFLPETGSDGTGGYLIEIVTQNDILNEVLWLRRGKYLSWAYKYSIAKVTFETQSDKRITHETYIIQDTGWSDDLGDGRPPH